MGEEVGGVELPESEGFQVYGTVWSVQRGMGGGAGAAGAPGFEGSPSPVESFTGKGLYLAEDTLGTARGLHKNCKNFFSGSGNAMHVEELDMC